MRLYIVRHADANPKEADAERHLSPEGEKEMRQVARLLKPLGLRVGVIWHSGKTRAAETAEILATAIRSAAGIVQHSGLDPDDPVRPIAKEAEAAPTDLALVSHLPMVGLLASRLLVGKEIGGLLGFATATVACMERDDAGQWRLVWMVGPEVAPPGPGEKH